MECPVCLDTFTRPLRVDDCGHILCTPCLAMHEQSSGGGNLACPSAGCGAPILGAGIVMLGDNCASMTEEERELWGNWKLQPTTPQQRSFMSESDEEPAPADTPGPSGARRRSVRSRRPRIRLIEEMEQDSSQMRVVENSSDERSLSPSPNESVELPSPERNTRGSVAITPQPPSPVGSVAISLPPSSPVGSVAISLPPSSPVLEGAEEEINSQVRGENLYFAIIPNTTKTHEEEVLSRVREQMTIRQNPISLINFTQVAEDIILEHPGSFFGNSNLRNLSRICDRAFTNARERIRDDDLSSGRTGGEGEPPSRIHDHVWHINCIDQSVTNGGRGAATRQHRRRGAGGNRRGAGRRRRGQQALLPPSAIHIEQDSQSVGELENHGNEAEELLDNSQQERNQRAEDGRSVRNASLSDRGGPSRPNGRFPRMETRLADSLQDVQERGGGMLMWATEDRNLREERRKASDLEKLAKQEEIERQRQAHEKQMLEREYELKSQAAKEANEMRLEAVREAEAREMRLMAFISGMVRGHMGSFQDKGPQP